MPSVTIHLQAELRKIMNLPLIKNPIVDIYDTIKDCSNIFSTNPAMGSRNEEKH